jgi:DNA helicase-2/ATP-dependent DNA helicase PcrA
MSVMTSATPMTDRTPARLDTPEQLRALMGTDFTFSAAQFAAITAPLEPGVIIAGAGSGKTTVMAARVVWLVATGQVSSDQVLGLTFTTKATNELGSRIRDALRKAGLVAAPGDSGEVEEPTVATYHSYAANLLTEYGLRIGHEPDTRLVADASRYQLAARAIARYTRPIQHLTDHPETAIKNLLALDAAMTEHLVSPRAVREYDAKHRPLFAEAIEGETRKTYRDKNEKAISAIDRRAELLDLVEAYRALKAGLGLMDFADQIALAAQLARDCPEVGKSERDKFRVVLLDEYQDTSVAQALMLRRLFSGADPASGLGHPVTAVGDPNQAIYGWRGASVSNILNFAADFPTAHGKATSYPLVVNRRSDRRILEAANDLAAELYAGHPELQPLEAKDDAGEGVVRLAVHERYDDELAWLPDQIIAFRNGMARPLWKEIGVLTRDNAHAADVFDALTAREIPVEIVGLKGLLRLPEVAEVVATLTLLQDVTANASLLTLLNGPRWAIGPRDLALLGRRATDLAREHGRDRTAEQTLEAALDAAVAGADPTEIASLSDALADPGDYDYSAEARERFGLLADELRRLRAAVGEPLLDLVRRIIDTTGIDIELASSVSAAAAARRDNLDLFVKAVAEFQAVDGSVTLPALLAWLEAEDEFGSGLDVATPTEADSVKLLTVHRAKGLEWDAVFLVGVAERKFPTERSRAKWVTSPAVLPTDLRGDRADLPQLRGHTKDDLDRLHTDAKAYEAVEERRLGYVAWTRARHQLVVSSYCWAAHNKTPAGPSEYQHRTRETMARWGLQPELWLDRPEKGSSNPYAELDPDLPWPITHQTPEAQRRVRAAARVRAAIEELAAGPVEDEGLDMLELQRVQEWDDEMARLLEEAARQRSGTVAVPLPSSLSATALARLRDDPDRFARELARPMPRKPSPSARFGTRFHAWVEARFGQQQIIDPDELPGRADAGIDGDDDLRALTRAFESGPFADRVPEAVEPPFALVLGGQVVRGRIDAVYLDDAPGADRGEPSYLVVDWKTNREQTADPLQLAIYRVAWAELCGVPVERVRAAFYYVRSGELVEPDDLPRRRDLEALLRSTAEK